MPQESTPFSNLATFTFSAAEPSAPGISVLDLASLLLRNVWRIAAATIAVAILTAVIVYSLPVWYKAEALILTPQQQQPSLSALSTLSGSGLAGTSMASQLGLKNPADLYIGLLRSRTISEQITQRFHLKEVYGAKLASQARRILSKRVTFEAGKDSLIKIMVEDHDPSRAAAIANAYIDELHRENSQLALSDASQRRLFFEDQLRREKDALANAEVDLKRTQEGTGLIAPTGQAEILLRSGAQMRAEIASREVQLQGMRSFATDENPQVQTLRKEISTLRSQLSQIESSASSGSPLELSGRKLPEAGLLYIRKAREVKYHETLFELLSKQYEASRMDEAKQAPTIQVVDRATVPDSKSGPSRLLTVLGAAVFAFVLSSVAIVAASLGSRYLKSVRTLTAHASQQIEFARN